jgi:hypothetical protein
MVVVLLVAANTQTNIQRQLLVCHGWGLKGRNHGIIYMYTVETSDNVWIWNSWFLLIIIRLKYRFSFHPCSPHLQYIQAWHMQIRAFQN